MSRFWSTFWFVGLLLALVTSGCEKTESTGATAGEPPIVTAGGFGHGDPGAVPAFHRALLAGQTVTRLTPPRTGGGNMELINALFSPGVLSAGQRQPRARALRDAVTEALDHPSARPSRLFYIERAYALEGSGPTVLLLICDSCRTATLAMRPGGKGNDVVLPPQFDLSKLEASFSP